MPVEKVTTTIESEVVYMIDPTVEFVSLVKHGANRTPFVILKNDKGGAMSKVVQAILLEKSLPIDEAEKYLADYATDNVVDGKTHKSYIQKDEELFEKGSFESEKLADGVELIKGVLKSEDTTVEDEKAIDYDTLDDLYTELYSMADLVSGAMRQSGADMEFRKTTILSAIDNFRKYADEVLGNLDDDAKCIKFASHTGFKLEKDATEVEPTEDAAEEDTVETTEDTSVDAADETPDSSDSDVGETTEEETTEEAEEDTAEEKTEKDPLDSIKDMLSGISDRLKKLEDNSKKFEDIEKSIGELKIIPLNSKTGTDETVEEETKKSVFSGLIAL